MLVTAKTTTPKYFYIIIMQFLHYVQSASFGMPAITAFWKRHVSSLHLDSNARKIKKLQMWKNKAEETQVA